MLSYILNYLRTDRGYETTLANAIVGVDLSKEQLAVYDRVLHNIRCYLRANTNAEIRNTWKIVLLSLRELKKYE